MLDCQFEKITDMDGSSLSKCLRGGGGVGGGGGSETIPTSTPRAIPIGEMNISPPLKFAELGSFSWSSTRSGQILTVYVSDTEKKDSLHLKSSSRQWGLFGY